MQRLLICALFTACSAHAETPESISQRLLDALRNTSGVPGLGAAVTVNGVLRWQGSSGFADLLTQRPVRRDTRFRLASVSKLLGATAAAKLHEEGRLDAEAPLPKGLLGPLQQGITLRQLAAHTSGLPHYEARDASRGGTRFEDSRSAARAFVFDRAPLFPPGQRYAYSSWGYTLLGAAVELAAGAPLEAVLDEHITLGLDISRDTTDSGDARASRAYALRSGAWQPAPPHDHSYSLAGAALAATPEALARWGGALLQGRVVRSGTVAWMMQPTLLSSGEPAAQPGYTVGFGWRVAVPRAGETLPGPVWHHAGATTGARSALVLLPQRALAVALLSNAQWTSSIEDSARTLAAPFVDAPSGTKTCTEAGRRWLLQLGSQRWQGRVQGPGCDAVLQPDGGAPPLPNGGPGDAEAPRLRLVAIDAQRAALATPQGLFELRWAGPTRLAGFSSQRTVLLCLGDEATDACR